MKSFRENFRPDPEMEGERWIWRTRKPLFIDAVVAFAPPYPEYPKLKVTKRRGPTNDPSCPSARDAGEEIDVILYGEDDAPGGPREEAWNYLVENTAAIEAALRRKLIARHRKYLQSFVEEELPEDPRLRKYWKTIESQIDPNADSAVDRLFKLVAVGLAGPGLDSCGFYSFEFQTGWDRDHGLGVLMHRDRVLAAGGMGEEICRGESIVESVKCTQAYDMDEGDYSLLDS